MPEQRGRAFPHTAPDRGVGIGDAAVVEDANLCVEHGL